MLGSRKHLPCWKTAIRNSGIPGKAQECGLLRSGVRPRSWHCYILACSPYLTLFLRAIPVIGNFLLLNIWGFPITLPSAHPPLVTMLSLTSPSTISTRVLMPSPPSSSWPSGRLPIIQRPLHQEEFLSDRGKLFNLSKLQIVPLGEKMRE